jgi:Xaa-Pro aminopeptidase
VRERIERLAGLAGEKKLDSLIVGDLVRPGDSGRADMVNLRWLTGFTGTSGLALVGPDQALFVTDFRYAERVRDEIDGVELVIAERQLVPAAAARLSGRVGFDDAHTSVHVHAKLEEAVGDDTELVPCAGLVEELRRQKDEAELGRIREAARLTDEVYAEVIAAGLAGRTELEVAEQAAAGIRARGGEPAFPAIVAAGPNGALPHAEPSEREIGAGELVVFDMGAELDGYCSDCTRTFAAGEPDADAREVYELVLAAQAAALEATKAGAAGRDVDAVARDLIAEAGHGDEFGHGLGHGVGVEVHEAPRLGKTSEDVLAVGDVVTIEPGVYVAGRFGVRIEDLVAVTEDGCENFSSLPKDLHVAG